MIDQKRGSIVPWIILTISTLLLVVILFLVFKVSSLEVVLLSLSLIISIFLLIFIYFDFFYPPARLKRKFKLVDELLIEGSVESLKKQYDLIYNLYLKVSRMKKRIYYPKILELREKITHLMISDKKIENLLDEADNQKNIVKRKQLYLEVDNLHKRLPIKSQNKHYSKLIHLRERLER